VSDCEKIINQTSQNGLLCLHSISVIKSPRHVCGFLVPMPMATT